MLHYFFNLYFQNAVRIARALFDIVLRQGNPLLAGRMLNLSKMLQLQMWDFHHPLFQFPYLGPDILSKIEERKKLSIEVLREMPVAEIGKILLLLLLLSYALVRFCTII
jgi:activating signal cointegrator complex subunit 3